MSAAALEQGLRASQVHARLQLALDDVLGTLHGFSWSDFRLLQALARAEGKRLSLAELSRVMGVTPSGVVRLLMPLEKTGQVQRATGFAMLRPAGEKQLKEAEENAGAVCAGVLAAPGLALER